MTTTIYKFEQGRLLVKESRVLETQYRVSGIPVRIGHIREVEEVISIDNSYSRYGLVTPLSEVRISGADIFVVMRRGELGGEATLLSGEGVSGSLSLGLMSSISSGLAFLGELASGVLNVSGKVTVTASVLGY